MSDVLQRVGELKTQAKNRRDLKRYDRAITLLTQAIDLLRHEYETSGIDAWRATVTSELADCWGILGGLYRRRALDPNVSPEERAASLRKSVEAYDEGFRFESDAVLGTATSTYNRLNRLISRILLDPKQLRGTAEQAERESSASLNMEAELGAVADQIRGGEDSVWAAADLALINVLLGRQDANAAYGAFRRKDPPDFACQSALDVVVPLAESDLEVGTELRSAERLLTTLRNKQHTG